MNRPGALMKDSICFAGAISGDESFEILAIVLSSTDSQSKYITPHGIDNSFSDFPHLSMRKELIWSRLFL